MRNLKGKTQEVLLKLDKLIVTESNKIENLDKPEKVHNIIVQKAMEMLDITKEEVEKLIEEIYEL